MERKGLVLVFLLILFSPFLSLSADVIGNTNTEVSKIAEPLLDNILEAFKTGNYEKYCRDFDNTLKESVSEKKFRQVRQWLQNTLGSYQSREYLGFLKKGKMSVVLWKAKFDKSEDDVLIKLVVSKRGNKYLVTGLWFQ
ncbi:MAG: DUF3887 domain-containing protein [Caldiserica bacterium]|nr:DUF3887 domain-containing protein [Caldisericota bacterium]